MRKLLTLIALTFILMLNSCDSNKGIPKKGEFIEQISNKDGSITQRKYFDGKIQNEFVYVNKKKNGQALVYYPNGKLHSKSTYKDGKLEGEAYWYYENEKLFDIRIFKNNKMEGNRKTYYESGQLKSEQKYKNNIPLIGLKEYKINGELIKQPTLVINKIDKLAFEDKYVINCNLSDNSKKVSFSQVKNKGKSEEYRNVISENNGIGELSFYVIRGDFLMEDITIHAEMKTDFNNLLILEKTIRVAVQNR